MAVNWNAVKARILRRKIVDVELPEFVEAKLLEAREHDIDVQADNQRRNALTKAGVTDLSPDRHVVRNHYRAFFGQP